MTQAVQDLLEAALRLPPDEFEEFIERLSEAVAFLDDGIEVPGWHLKIIKERLAQPDDDANTVSAAEFFDQLRSSLLVRRSANA